MPKLPLPPGPTLDELRTQIEKSHAIALAAEQTFWNILSLARQDNPDLVPHIQRFLELLQATTEATAEAMRMARELSPESTKGLKI